MDFKLHRLNITGPLDEIYTPIGVVILCLHSHGIEADWNRLLDDSDVRYRRKCIQKLTDSPPLVLQYKRDYGRAVRYINYQTKFTNQDAIIRSLTHLHKWETLNHDGIIQSIASREKIIGEVTEENPEGWDITILYRLCRQRGLQTDPGDTSETLFRRLCLEETPRERLLDYIFDRISVMTNVELINHVGKMLPDNFSFNREEFYNLYTSRRTEQHQFLNPLPLTNHEAIIMAAREFKTNISESGNPISEYKAILGNQFPVDPRLRAIMKVDSMAFNIEQRFSLNLPEYVYWTEDLKKMALEEGWEGRGSAYEHLKNTYYQPTFFSYGKGPLVGIIPENQYLPIECTNINDEDKNSLVLYGARNEITHFKVISWRELSATFSNYREFRNPMSETPELFPPYAIKKLLILARKPSADQTIANQRKTLITTIEKIHLDKKLIEDKLSDLKQQLDNNTVYRQEFREMFSKLYRLSLVMRSFAETDVLNPAGSGDVDPDTTQINVSNHLIILNSYLDTVTGYVRETFLNLPLVIYYSKTGVFTTSENSFDGFSIGGRLKIIYEGDSTYSISSCLRLSSNWFLSTVYYYETFMGMDPSFDIIKLSHIG